MTPHIPYIGVDLDGTLVHYDGWKAWNVFGPPIPLMVDRVKKWLSEGKEVRIFTARAAFDSDTCRVLGYTFCRDEIVSAIQDHLELIGLPRLAVTAIKEPGMYEFWDDRAVQVVANTGRTLTEEHIAEMEALKGKL